MPGRKAPEEARREDILRAAHAVAARGGVEALTVRAVAARAGVSHGTVLFHFRRRSQLVAALLERVVQATTVLPAPEADDRPAGRAGRLRALVRGEMERLAAEPRQFRLFLEYWSLGVRDRATRRTVSAALASYRSALREAAGSDTGDDAGDDAVAAVAVSLIHGCALQAAIDPEAFDVRRHLDVATELLDGLAPSASPAAG